MACAVALRAVTAFAPNGSALALSGLSGEGLLALIGTLSTAQRLAFAELLGLALAAAIPSLDFSTVANSQFIGSTPFLFTM